MNYHTERKIRVFLDTNILLKYFEGNNEITSLFSNKVIKKYRFVIDTVVLQETTFFCKREGIPPEKLNIFSNRVRIISSKVSLRDLEEKNYYRNIRNMIVHDNLRFHPNDLLSIVNAIENNIEFFCTYDQGILSISERLSDLFPIRFVHPKQILNSVYSNQNDLNL